MNSVPPVFQVGPSVVSSAVPAPIPAPVPAPIIGTIFQLLAEKSLSFPKSLKQETFE